MDLTARRILVTGASSGIGRACAAKLAALGAELVLVARNEARLAETLGMLAGSGHQILPFDLMNVEAIGSLPGMIQARERKISGLVHAAGICPLAPLAATTPDLLRSTMRINFDAFVELSRHFTKRFFFADGGSLVAISSVSSSIGWAGGGAYCASKAALDGFVRVLAIELARRRIRVNTVSPSNIKTRMNAGDASLHGAPDVAEALKSDEVRAAAQPLGLGEADDIADAVSFLLCDAARFITGTSLVVDGGYLAKGN